MPTPTEVMTQWMARAAESWKPLTEVVEDGDPFAVVAVIVTRESMDIAFTTPPGMQQGESVEMATGVLSTALQQLMFGNPEFVTEGEPDAE
ncbi:MAG: hypothetical protein AB7L91_06485 [Dehalococcoidia bacterium]